MVANGDIIQINSSYGTGEYIVVRHVVDGKEKFLLLSLKNLNRKQNFIDEVEFYKDMKINIRDINLKGIVESYIEYNEPETIKIEDYAPGLILKAKNNSDNYYSCIIVDINNRYDKTNWKYYLINLETFKLTQIEDFSYVIDNYYTFKDFKYTNLLLSIK